MQMIGRCDQCGMTNVEVKSTKIENNKIRTLCNQCRPADGAYAYWIPRKTFLLLVDNHLVSISICSLRSKTSLFQFRTAIGTCCLIMLSSTVHAIIVDSLPPWSLRGTKKAPWAEAHFSHLSLPYEIVNAEEDRNYGNNIKRKGKKKGKCKADTYGNRNPHKLNF